MIISHQRKFILFPDPLGQSAALERAFLPWADQEVVNTDDHDGDVPFYRGMSPTEVEWAFDAMGLAFRSYLRIAVVQNPYSRMAQLYRRIGRTDLLWQIRRGTGLGEPDFLRSLRHTRPDGNGAGNRTSPPWRRYGAWTAKEWFAGRISHAIRLEAIEEDIAATLGALGIAPGIDAIRPNLPDIADWSKLYNAQSNALIAERYGWDLAQFGYAHLRLSSAA